MGNGDNSIHHNHGHQHHHQQENEHDENVVRARISMLVATRVGMSIMKHDQRTFSGKDKEKHK